MDAQTKEDLVQLATKELRQYWQVEDDCAKRNGTKLEARGRLNKATGTVKYGGALGAFVVIELTFTNDFDELEEWTYNGSAYGLVAVAGVAEGMYVGEMPLDGEKWWMHLVVADAGLGVTRVTFIPRRGSFIGPSEGGGIAPPGVVYGVGHWRKK